MWPHRALVLRSARLLAGAGDAEDLAQDAMLRAFSALETFEPGADGRGAAAWLLRILRNVHIDRLRYVARRPDLTRRLDDGDEKISRLATAQGHGENEPACDSTMATDFAALLEQLSDERILEAIRDLPVELAWTLLLVDVQGLDHAEAAEVLQVPLGTVKSRAFRARRLLKQRLLQNAAAGDSEGVGKRRDDA
ncbi:MAG: sigma-70 family RNA polymerase sigma factor [Tepidisphaerales bacterium]